MIDSQQLLGEYLKEKGMDDSVSNADRHIIQWSDKAKTYLKCFVQAQKKPFMGEDIREYAENNGLIQPPSQRAWGSIIAWANKQNLIKLIGYKKVSNPKAHRANAALWIKWEI